MLARKPPTSLTRLLGRLVVAAIALGFSYSIWAQKPARTENIDRAPKKGDMMVFFTATVGDNVLKGSSTPGADGKATIRQTVDNGEWLIEYVIQPKAPDRFVGTFKVTRNGELQGHPTLEWLRDGSASTRISNDAGETQFALDVRANVHEAMQKNGDAPADTETSEAEPAAGVSPVSVDFRPAWQIDFLAQSNPQDQC